MKEAVVPLPIDVLRIVLETANRLGIQHVPSKDRWALEVAQREYDEVVRLAGLE